ncbi:hypothetical protein [Streptomyces sp. NBC_00557]|uniref:hypothetical protein n=1 Tax=Streptomyces sp. NBC_00557 TaxID=2975776 RepID=UPI002E7FC7D7|nr:hypothetical protein [Streptomyces sp. NBC_00557]WUC35342.1 hypothetical protein OG956_14470 [Streptomyces sp. NBC_00557]
MSRVSFEKKRAQQPAAHPAVIPVRVFGTGGASVGGTSVVAAPGEEIQQAVLDHLQRLAISVGAPIRATIHDDREGCVVPLEVSADGSSRVTGEAVRVATPVKPSVAAAAAPGRSATAAGVSRQEPVTVPRPPSAQPGSPALSQEQPAVVDAVSPTGVQDAPPVTRPQPVPAGTSQAPTGQFGPAPVMRAVQAPAPVVADPEPDLASMAPTTATPTPPRGFDAVAEEVLGDGPLTETAEGAELLAGPMARINEAVRSGRIEAAAELAGRTVAEATTVLGPGHAEVLHLRELSAYIAYLGGDPVRACRQSLDLARLRRQARDAEAAYGNVQSAATAWRAVRDPEEGLRLGHDLIELWTDLTNEPGPAADDPRPLESARARMVRLTDRAARAARP